VTVISALNQNDAQDFGERRIIGKRLARLGGERIGAVGLGRIGGVKPGELFLGRGKIRLAVQDFLAGLFRANNVGNEFAGGGPRHERRDVIRFGFQNFVNPAAGGGGLCRRGGQSN